MVRVAIVTGAARGIGRAIVQRLLDDRWRVVAVDLPKSLRRFRGPNRVAIEGDVADEATARTAVKAALDRFGRLDAVVSNAGLIVRKRCASSRCLNGTRSSIPT